jgi:phosphomethylpyrimidine synthase
MKITQEVRDYAAERGLAAERAVASGMEEQAVRFRETGSEVYKEV